MEPLQLARVVKETKNGYMCALCQSCGNISAKQGKGMWITLPCTNKNAANAVSKTSNCHIFAESTVRADQPTLPEVKERLTPGDLELVQKRMRVIYTLAKKNIALIHYADLNELCDLNGALITSERLANWT